MKGPLKYTHSALGLSGNATEKIMSSTRSVIEKSKKLRKPSSRVDKIGTAVSGLASISLIVVAIVQLFGEKPLWAVGTLSVGAVSLVSNRIHHNRIKNRK
ncbi:MAG: hypothetical protein Q4D16_06330 [Eubacteriales bacterium]|nr:hypothetical protein [Eubacteriales bacterium]